jgi:6-phosphogluconolactonase
MLKAFATSDLRRWGAFMVPRFWAQGSARIVGLLFLFAFWVASAGSAQAPTSSAVLVYFGTYTDGTSRGVYVSRFDGDSGALSAPRLAAATSNPSFLAAHPTGSLLYAVNEVETYRDRPVGSVAAFRIDRATGLLQTLNQQSSAGAGPAHLSVDRAGRNLLVANYGGGDIAVLPIGADGRLGPASAFVQHVGSSVNKKRQNEPHAHWIGVDPSNRHVYVADLGLDQVLAYRFDPQAGSLVSEAAASGRLEPGAGTRHLAFDEAGRYAYVINELTCTVTVLGRDAASGSLHALQTVSTLPAGRSLQPTDSAAEIQVHPSDRFLYASNRGHDSITVFAIDRGTDRLSFVQSASTLGRTPRGFGIAPDGRHLLVANQASNSVVVFSIDPERGVLAPTGHAIDVDAPVCVTFVR